MKIPKSHCILYSLYNYSQIIIVRYIIVISRCSSSPPVLLKPSFPLMNPFLHQLSEILNFSVTSVVGKISNLLLKPSLIHYESSILNQFQFYGSLLSMQNQKVRVEMQTCLMVSPEQLVMWYKLKIYS